MQKKVDIKRA